MKIGLLSYGYTGHHFAQLALSKGHKLWGTSRDVGALPYDVPAGVDLVSFAEKPIANCLQDTEGLLLSIPPAAQGADALVMLRPLILQHKHKLRWLVYLSSTGVYGDHQGAWVDESSPCYAKTLRARNRLAAEQACLALYEAYGLSVMIFRLAGIYGPGRNALERFKKGKNTSVFKPGQYFSRIHVMDIAVALLQSLISPMPGEIFNLADDVPCAAHEVDAFAAQLLQQEEPALIPYEQANLSPMAQEFYASNRRVSNKKLKHYWLPTLRYPSYKEGLLALV